MAVTKTQGQNRHIDGVKSKDSTLDPQKQRWIKGQELYRSGAVSIGKDGYFYVTGFKVNEQKINCECPDYKERKQPCKHFYAVRAYQKNGKPQRGNTDGTTLVKDGNKSENSPQNGSEEPQKGNGKDTGRQATITRLAVLNTATQILQSHNKAISYDDVITLASRLEAWARGG